ncbi:MULTISPECIES: DeoR/GlpR family transcriptional regulator [Salinivibrio]|uniref:DeoR/GlpR family transcriptional regulator n=1 Tax=Salinivibrio TaxID=51366 RepID=UPI0009883554|nr:MULTISPECIES: DeoR/GlpR family transcriptional regulator [Salinivibrio]OOE61314.1 DeoR/GlpR family transcriptional regulator [Salinivibrio sp. IB282]WBA18005.1 DeoR/GlpR family transcriptional regulator [Salinivibrio kushneri]
MKQNKRHQQIIDLVKSQGYVSTEDLVERFNVSPQTIRRDLNELAAENHIRRHHGGATVPSSSENTAYATRKVLQQHEKDTIAQALVQHIPDGATLFIDIGTTPEAVARALLDHQNLRVVTNNLNAAAILMPKQDFTVIIAGGEVRNRDGGIVGEATLDFVSQFRLDFGILGISGIDDDGSLLDFDYHEVRVKKAILDNSRCVMLAADHTKFGRNAMVNLGNITQLDMVFTDATPPAQIRDMLSAQGSHLEVISHPGWVADVTVESSLV